MTTFTIWRADDGGMVRIEDAEGGSIVLMPDEVQALAQALVPKKKGSPRPDQAKRMREAHAVLAARRAAAE